MAGKSWGNILFFFLWLLSHPLFALPQGIRHYSVNDGLSQSSVYNFFQDRTGFLWIGTGDGLNKFDGYKFTVFKHENNDSQSLSNNVIRGILEDSTGNIWIGTEDGLNKYDPITNKITRITLPYPKIYKTRCVFIMGIYGDGLYLQLRNQGIFCYNIKKRSISNITFIDSNSTERCFSKDNHGFWYSRISGEVIRFQYGQKTKEEFRPHFPFEVNYINQVTREDKDNLLICTSMGLWRYNSQSAKTGQICPVVKERDIRDIIDDNRGNHYLAVNNVGIYVFNKDWQLVNKYSGSDKNGNEAGYSLQNVVRFYKDRSGNIWVGTDGDGICILSMNQLKFSHINAGSDYPFHIPANFIKCFYEEGDSILWIGSFQHGLISVNRKNGKTEVFEHIEGSLGALPDNVVYNITEDGGRLWIGTETGLYLFDRKKKLFSKVKNDNDPTEYNQIYGALKKKDGTILISTQSNVFELIKDKALYLKKINLQQYAKCLFENGNDLLAGTERFGFYIIREGKIMQPDGLLPRELYTAGFQCFYKDKNGFIWAATSMGLLKMTADYKVVKLYDVNNGLPDNFLYSILNDSKGNLWISTNKGLCVFDPAAEKCRVFNLSDGIQSYEYNTGAFYKSESGEMFFGGVNGFNYFYPDSIKYNPYLPKVVLTDLKIFDKKAIVDTAIWRKKNLILPYNKNTVSFEFTGLEFSDPAKAQYASYLEGLDKGWFYSGTDRFVRYSGLAPGTYHLWLKASNNDGLWSDATEMMTIVILPPFWQTWWFISFLAIFSLGITILAVRNISNRKLKKTLAVMERQQELERIRNRISRDIHDDIGSGLTKISMISQAARMDITRDRNIDEKLHKLSDSALDLSDRLQEIVWAMNPTHDNLKSTIAFFRAYAYDFFENTNIKTHFDLPDNLTEDTINPDIRRNLFLCMKEALNNIAKYSCARDVFLQIKITDKQFFMLVKDNGKGFGDITPVKGGNGLINMRKRMEEIGGSYSLESIPDAGTKLIFTVLL